MTSDLFSNHFPTGVRIMVTKPYLYPIFFSLFICSVSLSMLDPRDDPYSEHDHNHRPQGQYNNPEEINSELYKQIIETAPEEIQFLAEGLVLTREKNRKLESLDNVLLYGESENGKTLLAKAMGIVAFSKYYYIPSHYALSSCESCRNQFDTEIDYLIQKGEPIAVILDDIICNSAYSYRYNFLASAISKCAWKAPFLFIIAITNNEIDDFPDALINRFKYNKIHIPYPNLSSRNQIISHYLNKGEHTLTTDDINELAQRFNGRTCRSIKRLMETASVLSLMNNNITTLEEIECAEEENPYRPSKHELLARKFNISLERAQELWSEKYILKKHRTMTQYLYRELVYTLEKLRFGQTAEVTEFEQKFKTTLVINEQTNVDEITARLNNLTLLLDAEEYMTLTDELLFGYTK